MFYESVNVDRFLRFGDVIQGFAYSTPNINNPTSDISFNIDIIYPEFCIVMTPCCSIENKIIALTPLVQIQKGMIFDNPYFVKDLTNINRPMKTKNAMHPSQFEKLEPEEQAAATISQTYAFYENFIYEGKGVFPTYKVNRKNGSIETDYYMIDFKSIFRVNCDKIVRNVDAPSKVKYLQLSIETRKQLREKISHYFYRIPEEDAEGLDDLGIFENAAFSLSK